ncbi:MAG: transporter substrate-binding domain-containing protein [Pseudomonadota bacterium]
MVGAAGRALALRLFGCNGNPRVSGKCPNRTFPAGFSAALVALILTGVLIADVHGAQGTPVLLTADERAWLDRNPDKLTLFFNTEFPPIEFSSPDGAFIGMGADVIGMIEGRLGVRFIQSPSDDWNQHLAALASGACAIAPTIVRTPERGLFAYFTTPYATVPVVIIGTRQLPTGLTLADFSGKRVAVVSGYATEKYVNDQSQGRFAVVPMPDVVYGLRAVSFGQVDAFVENLAVAAYFIDQEGIPNLSVVGGTDYAFAFSIGVSRKYPLLFSAMQKAMDAIPEMDLEAIRKRWISLQGHRGIAPETRRLLTLVAVFSALLLAGLAGISYILKRRLDEKVASLKNAQEELAHSEARFRAIFEYAPYAIVINSLEDGRFLEANKAFLESRGVSREEILTMTTKDVALFSEDEAANIRAEILKKGSVRNMEATVRKLDGTFAHVIYSSGLLEIQGQKQILSMTVDVTERKQAEMEREKLQGQLLQSQKLEAVGILAGGVAHDFNNMLGAIIGYSELTMDRMDPEDPSRGNIRKILDAAHRSANLTRQLLAFARKQTVAPIVFDLNESVEAMLKMLRRLIGENIDLAWLPGAGRCPVNMDPSQLDQILANLCVNARDAIADVGKLSIKTGTVSLNAADCESYADSTPGEYVLLAVSDTGCGMGKETMSHVFEPFYTTKGVGKGTGLGLSTVYGIVKQNEGFIHLYSEPGMGTTFEIYFPRHIGDAPVEKVVVSDDIPLSRGETILVVEDDPILREMGQAMLQRLGYTVLVAGSPGEAIRLAEETSTDIHLFLIDVVMPEMNGRELADRLVAIRPALKYLFMSGYTADVIVHRGVLEDRVNFIQKPFSIRDLAVRIREILDAG